MNSPSLTESTRLDAATQEAYRREIARLPITMQPNLHQQLSGWANLFPYEQKRFAEFVHGISLFAPDRLNLLTGPLRDLEAKMGVAHWNFSASADTMENASQLARSSYYAEWRREVQRVFSEIDLAARQSAAPRSSAGRLVVLVLPEELPVASIAGHKPWDARALGFQIDGDARRICDLAVEGKDGLPALLAAQSSGEPGAESADCWLIDATAKLGGLLRAQDAVPASVLEYSVLKAFRDEFLSQVNAVPKDIEASDQILAQVRQKNWDKQWPAGLAGQDRLRSFVIELFLSGNGAMIFSNAFVQWAGSEALRRARPRLLIGRFGLRSKPKPFTSIAVFENQQKISALADVDDPQGSAVDALILARYIWLSALRYPEQEHTCCVCVAESSRTIQVIAPAEKRPDWPAGSRVSPEVVHAWMRRQLMGH